MAPRSAALLILLATTGCRGMSITGTVTDPAGNPVPDARIAVVGQLCFAHSDAEGIFELKCDPGEYEVAIAKAGYISNELDIDASERRNYDVGIRTLIAIPHGQGVFLFDGADYIDMEPGYVHRTTSRDGARRAYCMLEDAPANKVPSGRVSFFDKEADDWLLFRLDDDRCARILEPGPNGWKIAWNDTPDPVVLDVGLEQSVHLFDLEPGEHFLAWWHRGSFAQDKKASEQRNDRLYLGYRITVE